MPRSSVPRSRQALGLLACAVSAFALLACNGEGTAPETIATLTISPASATIASRAPLPLSASPRTASGKTVRTSPVAWSSSDTSVARVSSLGLVTAGVVTAGVPRTAVITATSVGVAGQATISVAPAAVATVVGSPASASIGVGGTQQFGAALTDALGVPLSGRAVAWSSSDTLVATVDSTGLVTARSYAGGDVRSATIAASSEGHAGSATIQVTPLPVAAVALDPEAVAVGDTRLLAATVRSATGTVLWGRTLTWTSSDTTIAVVNAAGLAIPVARWDDVVRDVTITASVDGVSGSAILTVRPAAVGQIVITPGAGTIASGGFGAVTGVAKTISGVVLPGRTITWESSDSTMLAVSPIGTLTAGIVTSAAAVPVTITATADGFSETAIFSVLPSAVASIELNADSLALFPRATSQLTATLRNAAGTPLTGRAITWTSQDPTVVVVSTTGLLTFPPYSGNLTRSTVVIATSESAVDTLKVVARPNSVRAVSMSAMSYAMPVGASERVHPTLRDELDLPLQDRPVTWTSSNPAVATVSDSGVITMVGTGTATISAQADSAIGIVRVGTLSAAIMPNSVAGGSYHHCGLTSTGEAYCWGYNYHGQLGNGTNVDAVAPVAVVGGLRFVQLTAGGEFTCGIAVDRKTWCWGENSAGELGDGSANHQNHPVLVVGTQEFTSIVAGSFHACGLTADGVAYCWGRNNTLSLGDGTNIDRFTPMPVVGDLRFTVLSSRHGHTCGLTAEGVPYCWGRNVYGAVGDGTRTARSAPTLMLGGRRFVAIAAGWEHTCGLTSAGEVDCISRNQYGQAADGTWTLRDTFVRAGGLPPIRSLYNGHYDLCAISTTDQLFCWGRNRVGELADGTILDRNVPVAMFPGESFTHVALAYSHTCSVLPSTTIRCHGILRGGVGYSRLEGISDGLEAMRRVASARGRAGW